MKALTLHEMIKPYDDGKDENGYLACPFCGGKADPDGWLDGQGNRGPECENCGATAESKEAWNRRV